MDCSSPGSSVHGIVQARILEWVVIESRSGIEEYDDIYVDLFKLIYDIRRYYYAYSKRNTNW